MSGPDSLVEAPELARAFLARRADTPATCSALIRHEAIAAVGGFESGFPGLYEDQTFFFKVCLALPVWVEGEAWDRYRRHPDALCEVKIRAGEHADDYRPTVPRWQFLRWLETYFDRAAITDPALRRDLGRELWPYRHPTIAGLIERGRPAARAVLPVPVRRLVRRFVSR